MVSLDGEFVFFKGKGYRCSVYGFTLALRNEYSIRFHQISVQCVKKAMIYHTKYKLLQPDGGRRGLDRMVVGNRFLSSLML